MVLAQVLDYYTQQPAHLRQAMKKVVLEQGPNPADPLWEEKYGDGEPPPFKSAATAGGGTITFWNSAEDLSNLNPGTFDHEFGHLVGEYVENQQDGFFENLREKVTGKESGAKTPAGWEEAIAADGASVSDYGENSPTEDFAESWHEYKAAREAGPEALAAFREKYPNRVAIMDQIYNDTYQD